MKCDVLFSRYKSQYSSSVKDFYDRQKSPIPRTMGYMQTPLKTPQDYLKKHSGERKLESGKYYIYFKLSKVVR